MKFSGTFGSSTRTWADKVHQTQAQAQASSLGGDTIGINAGRDITVAGSNVVSDNGTALQAGRDVNILAATETSSEQHFHKETSSGLLSGGGIGFTIGSRMQSTDQAATNSTAAASTVGSVKGNVNVVAGNAYRQTGSDVMAPQGDINVVAKDIAITEAEQTHSSETHTKFKQSGLSVSISAPVISMLQTASSLADAAGKTSDGRMQALAAGGAALTAYNSKDELSALANGKPADANVSISITVGSSQSRSDSVQNSTSSHGSNLQAGGNVNLIATGAGKDSNIHVQGSDIMAGKDVTLIADNQVNLLASQDTSSDRSTNSSSSAAVGVAVTVGQGGASFGITASASQGKGHANSDDVAYSNTHVNAGNTVTIQSGGDTTLQGAVVSGKQVVADIGGNLNLESLQDTSTFSGKQQNIGGSVTVGAGFSGSVSYSKSKVKGDFASVNEQTGIQAGDGGFQVNVKGNTDLKGAVIASNQTAIDNNRNSLTTGTLTHSDIENHSDYKASGINLSGGISVAGSKPAGKPESSGGNTGNNGANWSWHNPNKSGVNSAAAGISSDSGNERSTTHSGISAGAVTITDEAGQQQKTGQSASEAAASIQSNVLTGDGSNGLQKNWDGQKLLQEQAANAQIMATFGQQASKAVGDYATQKFKEAQASEDKAGMEAWREGGAARVALHTLVGGLGGGLAGALGAGAASAAAPALDQLQQQFQSALQNSGLGEEAAKAIASLAGGATAATVGAVAGGGSAAGAAVGFNADMNNRQLHPNEKQRVKELASNKAKEICQADTTCLTRATLYWTDMLERVAEARVDIQEASKNQAYYKQIIGAAAQFGSEAAMGGTQYFFDNLNQAIQMLNADAGKIIVNSQGVPVLGSDGKPQTYFSATQAQRENSYGNIFPGGSPDTQISIIPGRERRDQEWLDRLNTLNGQTKPDTTFEEFFMGGKAAESVAKGIVRLLGSEADVLFAGSVNPSLKGNIGIRQVTEQALPVQLTKEEILLLGQLDNAPSAEAGGYLREYISNNYFLRNGYRSLEGKCGGGNCFDGVYIRGDKVIINEVKPMSANGSIKLSGANPATGLPTQMTDAWVRNAVARLENSGNDAAKETAKIIIDAYDRGNLIKTITGVRSDGINLVKIP